MKKRIVIASSLLCAAVLFLSAVVLTYFAGGQLLMQTQGDLEWSVASLAKASGDAAGAVTLIQAQEAKDPSLIVLDQAGRTLAGKEEAARLLDAAAIDEIIRVGSGSLRLGSREGTLLAAVSGLDSGEFLVAILPLPQLGSNGFWADALPALLLIFILAALGAYLLSRYILKPVEDLTRSASRICAGELSSRIRLKNTPELERLAENFNTLSDHLETTLIDSLGNQAQLEAILGSMNSGVIAVDKNNKIIIFNPFASRIFGIFNDVIGKEIGEVINNTDLCKMLTVHDSFEELTLRKDNPVTLRFKTTELSMEQSQQKGKVTVIQDITDLKKLELMRSQFVANVSHELKTPLTSIKGFTETLRDVEDLAIRNKFLDIIDAESERLRRLIEDILSLSAIENQDSAGTVIVDAAEVTISSLKLLEVQARNKNIDFSLIIKGEPHFIGDPDMFRQLVLNLADNAIKYTEDNGKVKVRLEEERDNIHLYVQDTGIGIAPEHIPRLFERFYRVDKSRNRAMGGTGLGLAIVKHIVIVFGGSIQVESKPGRGTTFSVTIPAHREKNQAVGTRIQSFKLYD